MKTKIRLAIFASGSGSNAENIIRHFQHHPSVEVCCVLCNKQGAYVLERTAPYGVKQKVFSRDEMYNSDDVLHYLNTFHVDYLILAGFLWLMPQRIVDAYPERIINIHPALLPAYGGKGMYGMRVHEAVVAAGEKETGITIHLVNEKYDEGKSLFQARVALTAKDTPETVAEKIHELEQTHFPRVIEEYVMKHGQKPVPE